MKYRHQNHQSLFCTSKAKVSTHTFSFDLLLRSIPNRFALMNISLNFGMMLKQTKKPAADITALIARVKPLSPSSIVSNLASALPARSVGCHLTSREILRKLFTTKIQNWWTKRKTFEALIGLLWPDYSK